MKNINKNKIVLDLCGGTGAWSKPYREAGYDVRVITLPDYDIRHYSLPNESIYGILAAPPCTQFSFARTNAHFSRNLNEGMEIVVACLVIIWEAQKRLQKDTQKFSPLKFWALENPNRGMLKWFLGKPVFIFNPYDFGDDYKKETALWGYFNEPIKTPIQPTTTKFDMLLTREIHPEFYGKYDRQTRRSITPSGFAKAFFEANQ